MESSSGIYDEDIFQLFLETARYHPTHKINVQAYKDETMEKLKNGDYPLKRAIMKLLTFTTQCQNRKTESHIRMFIQEATATLPTFATSFSSVLENKIQLVTNTFPSARLNALRWCSAILRVLCQAKQDEIHRETMKSIIHSQSILLESTCYDTNHKQGLARSNVLSLLCTFPTPIVSICIENILNTTSKQEETQYQLWYILFVYTNLPHTKVHIEQEAREQMWEKYVYWAFGSKSKKSITMESLDIRFVNINIKTFESIFVPGISKQLKKSPDSILQNVVILVRAIGPRIDFGKYLDSMFLSVLTSKLKSQNHEVRELTVNLAKEIISTMTNINDLKTLVESMGGLLGGKTGILAHYYQREAIFHVLLSASRQALHLSSSSSENESIIALADTASTFLMKAVQKEAHEGTRSLALITVSSWWHLLNADQVSKTLESWLNIITPSNNDHTTLAAYLHALIKFCNSTKGSFTTLESRLDICGKLFSNSVIKIILNAQKKPNVLNVHGLLALSFAGQLAMGCSSESGVEKLMLDEGVVNILLENESSSSFVPNTIRGLWKTVSDIADVDSVVLMPEVAAVETLPKCIQWALSTAQDITVCGPMYSLLVELLTFPLRNVREATKTTVNSIHNVSLDHTPGMVAAFRNKLSAVVAAKKEAVNSYMASSQSALGDTSTGLYGYIAPSPSVLRSVLRVIVPDALYTREDMVTSLLPVILFLSHHPLVVCGQKVASFSKEWKHVIRIKCIGPMKLLHNSSEDNNMKNHLDELEDKLIGSSETLQENIMQLLINSGDEGVLFSSFQVERVAGQRVVATLFKFAGEGESESLVLHELLQHKLIEVIRSLNLNSVTQFDAEMLHASSEEVYLGKKSDSEEATSSHRKTSHRGNEDEQWEAKVREELARKKKSTTGGKTKQTLSPEEKTLLKKQVARRAELELIIIKVSCVIELINTLSSSRPEELHAAIPFLYKAFQEFIGNPILSETLLPMAALRSLTRVMSPHSLRDVVWDDVLSCLYVATLLNKSNVISTELDDGEDELQFDSQIKSTFGRIESTWVRAIEMLSDHVFGGFQLESFAEYDPNGFVNHLTPPTFHLIFPILQNLVPTMGLFSNAPRDSTIAAKISLLPLFALHARMIPDEEEEDVGDSSAQRMLRQDMMSLTLNLLKRLASSDDKNLITNDDLQPQTILITLCNGDPLSEDEWKPLLGNEGLLSPFPAVRMACLNAISTVAQNESQPLETSDVYPDIKSTSTIMNRLYLASFDITPENAALSRTITSDILQTTPSVDYVYSLFELFSHKNENVRESAASAMAHGMCLFSDSSSSLLKQLTEQFLENIPKPVDQNDEFGIPKAVHRGGSSSPAGDADPIEIGSTILSRLGISRSLEQIALHNVPLSQDSVIKVITFVIEKGLSDLQSSVRSKMRVAGMALVDVYGGQDGATSILLRMFEQVLDRKVVAGKGVDALSIKVYDHQREGVVVFLGALAKHMPQNDPEVSKIVDSLLEALKIPSESVQRSVATCLTPLIKFEIVKARSTTILDTLIDRATKGPSFGERIGAAFGISAVIKGLGISALKQKDIIPRLESAMTTDANAREGSLLVFECLSERLGLLFEPYIIVILPLLLKCFADGASHVREAASTCSKKIMANLSGHGVKMLLPSLLAALEDNAWRTKTAGIQILGSMAYCAPRQLGSCLPMVVPKISESLTDSHPKVRAAGKLALKDVGYVVRNPEIAGIIETLLHAIEDPTKYTSSALQHLQSTSFVHTIDAPSLALVMPILTRGLKDRAGDSKKKSALIVGSMCSMINDPKDLLPYMDTVVPSLKSQLMDPIPEVRSISAKAMGKLVKGLGEKHFSNIFHWLLTAIKDEEYGAVERSGAAQGLCEVLVALGSERVEQTVFGEIIPLARHPTYSVREGVLWILAFLPPCYGKEFAVFLRDSLPVIVAGLSDEHESVRDVAMHAGHVVVNAFALSHTKEILPALKNGLFDDSWRIRQSSVTLLGDLMCRISGSKYISNVQGDGSDEESLSDDDDESDYVEGTNAGDRAIQKVLGIQERNEILASLYMIRSDNSAGVRHSALGVWKSVVANTPKTLRQILKPLIEAIVLALAGANREKQGMAGRALGDIVRKLGEMVMSEVVPILREGLHGHHPPSMRQGVVIGLTEVIESSSKRQIEPFIDALVEAILDALCDEDEDVRASASLAFDALHKGIGYKAIDETVPSLLDRIKSTDETKKKVALFGLQQMLGVKSREVLPYLIPRLLSLPLTLDAVTTMARVAEATGKVIHNQLERIFAVYFKEYITTDNKDVAECIKASLCDIVLSVQNTGLQSLAIELCNYCEKEIVAERELALLLIGAFCSATKTEYDEQVPLFLRQIVNHLNDSDMSVVTAASSALGSMNSTIRPEKLANHVEFIRQAINSLVSDARHRKGKGGAQLSEDAEFLLPGLCLPKALDPFLPSYQYALMSGSPEMRQIAASGLGELAQLSSLDSLKPYLIKLTGPLIRIAGDRFPTHVKSAILETLEILLTKGGAFLKPFLPQLQTTFVKALNDPASPEVRRHGSTALQRLALLTPRLDPLIAELSEKIKASDSSVREANLNALLSFVKTKEIGMKMSSNVKSQLEISLETQLDVEDTVIRSNSSACLAYVLLLSMETKEEDVINEMKSKFLHYVGADNLDSYSSMQWMKKHSCGLLATTFLTQLYVQNPDMIQDSVFYNSILETLLLLANDDHLTVQTSGMQALSALWKCYSSPKIIVQDPRCLSTLIENIQHPNRDVSKTSLKIVKRAAKQEPEVMRDHLQVLVGPIFALIKGGNIALKLPAERCLLYLLEVRTRPETLANFVQNSSDQVTGKLIAEYSRRVLMKLKPDSEDESD